MKSRFEHRRDQLRRLLRQTKAESLLVTSPINVMYLTGFTGDDSYLLLWRDGQVVLSDPRYETQLQEECPDLDLEIRVPGASLTASVARAVKAAGLQRLAYEAEAVSVALLERLRGAAPGPEWLPTTGLVEQLREIKDRDELEAIRQAVAHAERAFVVARASLRDEQTERDIAALIEHQIRAFGGEGCSFSPIVAVGERAALAHYRPGHIRVAESNLLLIDWGAVGEHYRSDLTRVLVTGKPTANLQRVYETVLAAQEAAISLIRPGALMADVDAAARNMIEKAGYGKRFGHSLGHGIGLEIHEQPRLAKQEQRMLRAGMVVTVEPGIYLPGWGGVRIEDDVLVTRSGHEVLSNLPKDFQESIVG